MARIRSIHYDACKSEKLQACSPEAERCYWRLLPHCDDAGRTEDDPRLLRASLFPLWEELRSDAVDGWIQELNDLGLLARYEADGKRYLVVTRWADYQKPNKPTPSKLPPPPEPLPEPSRSGTVVESAGVGDGDGEGVGDISPHAKRADAYSSDFDAWYSEYPRKIERAKAFAAYKARRREGIEAERLTQARDHYSKSVAGSEFVKYPASFLAKDGPWSEWEHGPPDGFAVTTSTVSAYQDLQRTPKAMTVTREVNGETQRFYPGTGWI